MKRLTATTLCAAALCLALAGTLWAQEVTAIATEEESQPLDYPNAPKPTTDDPESQEPPPL